MFKVTAKETLAVERIQDIYNSILFIAERAAYHLRFYYLSRRGKSERKKIQSLLETLNILLSCFNQRLPIIFEGKLYFQAPRIVPEGQLKPSVILMEAVCHEQEFHHYLQKLNDELAEALSSPEISKTLEEPIDGFYVHYLSEKNLGVASVLYYYTKH